MGLRTPGVHTRKTYTLGRWYLPREGQEAVRTSKEWLGYLIVLGMELAFLVAMIVVLVPRL